jgi:hypothetical protein
MTYLLKHPFTAVVSISLLIALGACSSNNDEPAPTSTPVPLHLTSTISEIESRASVATNNTQFASDEKAYAYVFNAGTATSLFANNELTAGIGGAFTAATAMYFPALGNVDIIASHPSLGASLPTNEYTHTVNSTQTSSTNYSASDLMWAAKLNQAETTSAVELTFYHQLAKIRVALVAGAGIDLTGATVKIGGTKLNAKFTPTKTEETPYQTITVDGTATDITIGADASPNFDAGIMYNDAVIVPQTLASGTAFIKVTLSGGGTLTYSLTAEKTFAQHTAYAYHVTVATTGLTVKSAQIIDWGTSTPVTGTTSAS